MASLASLLRRVALAHCGALVVCATAIAAVRPVASDPFRPSPLQSWTARVTVVNPAYSVPDTGRVVIYLSTRAHWDGGPDQLLVLASRKDAKGRLWLRVLLPVRPNGTSAWMRADYAQLAPTHWWISVSTKRRQLSVFYSGHLLRRVRAVVGKPSTPTPNGLFAISEIVAQDPPNSFLGPWALHLTSFSRVLDDYGGGAGRVAIHGRDGTSLRDPLGSARSHGCIRINDSVIRWLAARLVPGVPVTVR